MGNPRCQVSVIIKNRYSCLYLASKQSLIVYDWKTGRSEKIMNDSFRSINDEPLSLIIDDALYLVTPYQPLQYLKQIPVSVNMISNVSTITAESELVIEKLATTRSNLYLFAIAAFEKRDIYISGGYSKYRWYNSP